MSRSRLRVLGVLVLAAVMFLAGFYVDGVHAQSKGKLVIGGQEFAEHLIVSHMLGDLLEEAGYDVTRTLGLGGPQIVFAGMKRGEIDIWFSYSGTLASVILDKDLDVEQDPEELYRDNQRMMEELHGMVHLDTLGFNNTYVFAVKPEFAARHNLQKVSDLVPIAGDYRLAGSVNFMSDRPDGVKGVEQRYGIKFARNVQLETSFMYPALQSGQVDVIVGFSTHGQIADLDLVMLEDDRQVFPPYWAGVIINGDTAQEHPEVVEILDKLTGALDERTMAALNYEVEGPARKDPRAVARQFLMDTGLID